MKRLLRALLVLATSTLVVCGVKGPARPPLEETADAGRADGVGPPEGAGEGGGPAAGQGSDAGGPSVPSKDGPAR